MDISNDRAVILGRNNLLNNADKSSITILKLDATGKWIHDQFIAAGNVIDVAIEGTKLVYGKPDLGTGGRVVHLERSGATSWPWIVKSTVGLQQVGANPGFSVDLSNNEVAAGLFSYDYADIIDPCNPSPEFRANENAGGAMLYNFDRFNNTFFKNSNSFRNGEEENSTVINTLSVSPNPAEGGLVNIQVESTILDVAAVNALGVSTVLSFSETGADISNLTSGVYVLKVKTEMGNFDQKLLIK